MSWKKFITDYLTFSRKDRIGIISLLILIAVIYLLPHLFSKTPAFSELKEDSTLVKAMIINEKARNKPTNTENTISSDELTQANKIGTEQGTLFPFDPNTLTTDGWKRLGLKEHTIQTISHYLAKGGRFHKPEDLQKIWGLPKGFYEHVATSIKIANQSPALSNVLHVPSFTAKKREIIPFDINEADTSAFIALPGIGSRLANRIVNFREKLGEFYTIEQISETYALPDSTFQLIKPFLNVNNTRIRKLNVNTATKDELRAHPYIKWNLANAIVEYRNQHGPFSSLTDLKNIALINEDVYKKLTPYLSLQ